MSTFPTDSPTTAVEEPIQNKASEQDAADTAAHEGLFCDCGGLCVPRNDGWACRSCEQAFEQLTCDFELHTPQATRELDIVTEQFFCGPKTSVTCPTCGHEEAYYNLRQTRSADESETRFFTCASCEYEWREND